MNPDEYTRMRDLEDHYWWFVGRRTLALGLLRRYLNVGEPSEIPNPKARMEHLKPGIQNPLVLDLGCGTGVISQEMERWADVASLDMSDIALTFCRARGLKHLVQADATAMPIRTDTADAFVALDILEHVENDRAAFAEIHRCLRPGGLVVLSVPAFKWLWGPHDVALMHFRRYTLPEVRARLTDSGFEIVRISYSVFLLFPIVAIIRFFEKRKKGEPKASLVALPRWANATLKGIQGFEAWLIHRVRLPWGSSVIAVARKK